LTGVISIDKEIILGCKVEVIETGASQLTDSDGRFRLTVDDLDHVSLVVSYVDRLACKVVIDDIITDTRAVDLGIIPLFLMKQLVSLSMRN
jgi:hypothetical protein